MAKLIYDAERAMYFDTVTKLFYHSQAEGHREVNAYTYDIKQGKMVKVSEVLENTNQQPMDNNKQAVDITGYRVLSDLDKQLINILKKQEANTLELLNNMKKESDINQRSLELGIQNIQTGMMWAIRAIARPNGE